MGDRQKVLIDTDPGIDDILALLYALHTPSADVVAITTSHGNVSVEATTRNLETLFGVLYVQSHHHLQQPSHHGQPHPPSSKPNGMSVVDQHIPSQVYSRPVLARGQARPLNGQEQTYAAHVHGEDGMGNVGGHGAVQNLRDKFASSLLLPGTTATGGTGTSKSQRGSSGMSSTATSNKSGSASTGLLAEGEMYTWSPRDASDEMLYQLTQLPAQSLSIVCLGPLTNLAVAIQRDGKHLPALSKVKRIFVMGGCIHQPIPGGNVTPHAEFNFYADPDAAQVVLQSGLPITLVPLDVTETCRLRYGVYQETLVPLAKKAPLPSFCTGFLEHIFQFMHENLAEDGDEDLGDFSRSPSPSLRSNFNLVDLSNEVRVEGSQSDLGAGIETSGLSANHHAKTKSVEDLIESEVKQTVHIAKSTSLAMHDPLCMALFLNPSILIRTQTMPISIETTPGARTRGMCLIDGRRWKRKPTIREEREEWRLTLNGEGPKSVDVAIRVDTEEFFRGFMRVVFGVVWDAKRHGWVPQ